MNLLILASLFTDLTFSAGADFLLWKPKSSDGDFVNVININTYPPEVRYQEFGYDFEPGYRLFLAMKPSRSQWEFMATYEEINTNDQQSFPGGTGLSATSPLTFDPISLLYLNASATSCYRYQAAELAAYYNFSLCENHLFRPFVALQYLELKRKVHFSGITDLAALISVDFSSRYSAAGLTLGTEYVYEWLCNLQFYARGAATLNVGSLRTKINRQSNDPDVLSTQFHGHLSPLVPELRLAVGLKKSFCLFRQEVIAKAGYEFVDFFNTAQAPYTSTGGFHQSLTGAHFGFHGFTLGLESGF